MEIIVENTRITLTKDQVALIKKERAKRARCRNSFIKILRHFGFSPSKGNKNCFEQEKNNWWAEITDNGYFRSVWMVGKGLTQSKSFPGGWTYHSPEEIETELMRYNESSNP